MDHRNILIYSPTPEKIVPNLIAKCDIVLSIVGRKELQQVIPGSKTEFDAEALSEFRENAYRRWTLGRKEKAIFVFEDTGFEASVWSCVELKDIITNSFTLQIQVLFCTRTQRLLPYVRTQVYYIGITPPDPGWDQIPKWIQLLFAGRVHYENSWKRVKDNSEMLRLDLILSHSHTGTDPVSIVKIQDKE